MPERVWVNHKSGIIEVASEGVVTEAENVAALKQVIALIEKSGHRRVLADTRKQTVVPSIFGILKFGESLPRGIQFALIVDSIQSTAEIVELLRVIARSHGTCIELFPQRKTALAWLLNTPAP